MAGRVLSSLAFASALLGAFVRPGSASAELLPLACDRLIGSSAVLAYAGDAGLIELDELRECRDTPIGTWAGVSYANETLLTELDLRVEARSDDGFVLEASNDLFVDSSLPFVAGVALGAEASFESQVDLDADLVVEIVRTGELEDAYMAFAVVGIGLDVSEELTDEPAGVLRFPVELKAREPYLVVMTVDAALTESGEGSQALRFSVDTESVPEPGAAALLGTGAALLLGAARRRRRAA